MKRFILRYGLFAVLLLVAAGTLFILDRIEVRTKTSVSLFLLPDGDCMAYVARADAFAPAAGDTLAVDQTLSGPLTAVVRTVRHEPAYVVLRLRPLAGTPSRAPRFAGNSFSSGYVYTGRVRLRTLVFRQLGV